MQRLWTMEQEGFDMENSDFDKLQQVAHQLAKKRDHLRPGESAEHYVAGYRAAINDHNLMIGSINRLEKLASSFFEPGSAKTLQSAGRVLMEIQMEIRRVQIAAFDQKDVETPAQPRGIASSAPNSAHFN